MAPPPADLEWFLLKEGAGPLGPVVSFKGEVEGGVGARAAEAKGLALAFVTLELLEPPPASMGEEGPDDPAGVPFALCTRDWILGLMMAGPAHGGISMFAVCGPDMLTLLAVLLPYSAASDIILGPDCKLELRGAAGAGVAASWPIIEGAAFPTRMD